MLRELIDISQEIPVEDFSSLMYGNNSNMIINDFNKNDITDWEIFIIVFQTGKNSINIFINESIFDEIRHSFRVYTEVFNSTLVLRAAINNISRIFKIYDKIFDGKEVDKVYIDEKNSSLLINLRKC